MIVRVAGRVAEIAVKVEGAEQNRSLQLIVTPDALPRAGELLTAALRAVLAKRATARLAIPGGSALEAAAQARCELGEDWRRVLLTWVDERCVAFEAAESNRGAAARLGLFASAGDSISTSEPTSLLPLFLNGETPDRAVVRATRGFHELFSNAIDVALLGMGADGHVASIFSRQPRSSEQWVVHVRDSPKPPSDRITLTRRALETAGVVILVATGESKRDALTRLVNGDPTLPAQGLSGLIVVTDLELDPQRRKTTARRNPQ